MEWYIFYNLKSIVVKKFLFVLISFIPTLFIGCKKEVINPPAPSKLTISNLIYDPKNISVKVSDATFIISGTIDFTNASGGVASIRLTTSAGVDDTFPVPSNAEINGTLSGSFEVGRPTLAGTYTFQIWIVDNKGNSSNKLSGSLQLYVDASGSDWTVMPTSLPWPLNKVIFVNNKFHAVGDAGGIYRSSTGINWESPVPITNNRLMGIAWSGNRYIAVGENKTILISNDGENWTTVSTGVVSDYRLNAVCWNGNKFLAAGWDITNNKTVIISSANGLNWNMGSLSVSGGIINSIIWASNKFIAVGQFYANGEYHPLLLTSTDGIVWMNKSDAINGAGMLYDVIWTTNGFMAVGSGLTASSTNGITWNRHNVPDLSLNGIAFSGSTYAAVGNGIYTSPDGTNWTKRFNDDGLGYPVRSVVWTGCQFVAVGKLYNVIVSP